MLTNEAFLTVAQGVYKWDGATWTKMTMPVFSVGTGGQPSWSYITGPAKQRP